MLLWQLFLSFVKIGAFTLGGGLAMIPIMRKEVCEKHKWINELDFIDGIAAAQSAPGPIAINIGVYIGYRIAGIRGMLVAVFGSVLPSFISIIFIAAFLYNYAELVLVQKAFHALKPAVISLIAIPMIDMSKKVGLTLKNSWIPIIGLILVAFLNISPMYVIIVTIAFGIIAAYVKKRKAKD